MEVKYFSRVTGKTEIEKVYGEGAVKWLYENPLGNLFSSILTTKLCSSLYGLIQDTAWSKKKIIPFIKNYAISMEDFLPESGEYKNFNDFFIRKFRPGKRNFVTNPNVLAAFAEARYFGYESVTAEHKIPVKGVFLSATNLLENSKWSSFFEQGPLLLARLCPVDYHRFHFPDNGKVLDNYRVHGQYHSVNPIALKVKPEIFIKNERHVTILDTENFGKIAYIEVGAICVGKIIQSKSLAVGEQFHRGEEKGYFLFGGSTVIVLGEKGKWLPSLDILENTLKGIETYIHLGTALAVSK